MDSKKSPSPKRGSRNIFCLYYSDCLNVAISKEWSHWNCKNCEHQAKREAEPELPIYVNHSIAYYELFLKP